MNQNYGDMLQFLQGLLGNQQSTNASQFGQGLGFQQQQLTAQQQENAANLANQLALQNSQNAGQLANTTQQGQNAINLQAPQLAQQESQYQEGMSKGQLNDQAIQFLYSLYGSPDGAGSLGRVGALQGQLLDDASKWGYPMSTGQAYDIALASPGTASLASAVKAKY